MLQFFYLSLYLHIKKVTIMPETEITNLTNQLFQLALDKGPGLLLAVLTLIFVWWAINVFTRVIRKAISRSKNDISQLSSFFSRFFGIALKVMLFVSVASMIGIETTSFIAVLGAAGLAVGLALQGSLANFAGGILIIMFKPYKVGDFIEGNGGTGTVTRIDLLHTVLLTPDNKVITVPNGQLSNNSVTNYSMLEIRRLDFNVGIAYGADIKLARKVMLDTLVTDSRVLSDPEPVVHLTSLDDSSVNMSARVWVKTPDYWDVFFANLERIKESLDKNNIEIPFPQRDLHMRK
jgi:small conductance mechanosensitive channel